LRMPIFTSFALLIIFMRQLQFQLSVAQRVNHVSTASGSATRWRAEGGDWGTSMLGLRRIYDELRDQYGRSSNIFTASREYFARANIRVQKFMIQAAYTHYSAPDTPAGLPDRADHYRLGATWQPNARWVVTGACFHIHVEDGAGTRRDNGLPCM